LPEPQTVTVTGVGSSPTQPDVLVVQVGVEVTEASAREALDRASQAFSSVRDAVVDAGVDAARLQTGRVSLETNWEHWGERQPKVAGYVARIGLRFTLVDAQRLGDVLSAAAGAGGDALRIHSTAWTISDFGSARIEAREAAYADAQTRAAHYADQAGLTLGDVLQIVEGDASDQMVRYQGVAVAMAGAGLPVDAGEMNVHASVRVTWGLV